MKVYDGAGSEKLNPTTNANLGKSEFISFGWAGMYQEEFGLYHTHYREFDPFHRRWLSEDPAGYQDGQNLYRFYAGPNGVDLLGLDLLISFDGTNNDWGSDTNIRKIHELFDSEFKKYISGIGTGKDTAINSALGEGAQKRIDEALKWFEKIMEENPNEEFITITGFSRGAATARSFVNQIQPLLKKHDVKIKFIGVFDTVPAMGGKNDRGGRWWKEKVEHDLRLPKKYHESEIAFHAMSIHDDRSRFWLHRYKGAEEKWFSGAHSDIGGGYKKGEQGLSNIALRWMISNMERKNVPFIDFNMDVRFPVTKKNTIFHNPMGDSWVQWFANQRVKRRIPKSNKNSFTGRNDFHQSVGSMKYSILNGSWIVDKKVNIKKIEE